MSSGFRMMPSDPRYQRMVEWQTKEMMLANVGAEGDWEKIPFGRLFANRIRFAMRDEWQEIRGDNPESIMEWIKNADE